MDELRDRLAEAMGLTGWDAHKWGPGRGHDIGQQTCRVCGIVEDAGDFPKMRCLRAAHPVPALDSLEALGWAAKNMPEGWVVELNIMPSPHGVTAMATWPETAESVLKQAHTEAEARYKLVLAILKANAGVKP